MKLRTKVFAAVVLSFGVGAGAGFVGVSQQSQKQQDSTQNQQACHDILKDSFQKVFDGKPDPLKGAMPEPCTHLTKDVYDQISTNVMVEVSDAYAKAHPEA
jgi:hypothetical protein